MGINYKTEGSVLLVDSFGNVAITWMKTDKHCTFHKGNSSHVQLTKRQLQQLKEHIDQIIKDLE